MRRIALVAMVAVAILVFSCGEAKVTRYTEVDINSIAWAGDTLIAFVKNIERGFMAGGMKRNPQRSIELWLAEVDPNRGRVDTSYQIRQIPEELGRIEFFPGGEILLYAARDGVRKVNLISGERADFFTHPSIQDFPEEIDVGPNETYVAIVVDAEGFPGTESLRDIFMIETGGGHLVFHTDSLIDARAFAWASDDCIVYISPDEWEDGAVKIMQFGVSDCVVKPSDLTEEEVRCNCPMPGISASGLWKAYNEDGGLAISMVE